MAILVASVYGATVAAWRFRLARLEVRPPNWPAALDGLTVLHLTDLHCRASSGRVEAYLQALAAELEPPDLVVLTGDCCEGPRPVGSCAAALSQFRAKLGLYAILGNNDLHSARQIEATEQALAQAGWRVLRDEVVRLTHNGSEFALAAVHFVELTRQAKAFRLPLAPLLATVPGLPVIMLYHTPDAALEAAEAGVDLLLAGHTHGGQICLPGGYAPHSNLRRFHRNEHTVGLTQRGETLIHVARGLGMTQPCVRLNCPPEAVLLTLRSAHQVTT